MSSDIILVTGGTGKTGARLVERLIEQEREVRVASRSGTAPSPAQGIAFDWSDESTYAAALRDVGSVYLVAPVGVADVQTPMNRLIDQALAGGTRRFVLLSASSIEEGGAAMGQVHAYLHQNAPEWAVLRPSWFMQNFSDGPHAATIREEGRTYSATQEGKVPFIDTADIAECACSLLTQEKLENGDYVLTGSDLHTYDEVAQIISRVSGRAVEHAKLTVGELADRWEKFGLEPEYAEVLAAMDGAIADGAENRLTNHVEQLTGRVPKGFEQFASENRSAWTD